MFNRIQRLGLGFEPAFTLTGYVRPKGLMRNGTVMSGHGTLRSYLLLYVVYMRAPDETPGGTPRPPKTTSTVVLLLSDIADVTWRMFIPTIGGLLVGIWLDGIWHSSPWVAATGFVLGIVITALLVRQQVKKVS